MQIKHTSTQGNFKYFFENRIIFNLDNFPTYDQHEKIETLSEIKEFAKKTQEEIIKRKLKLKEGLRSVLDLQNLKFDPTNKDWMTDGKGTPDTSDDVSMRVQDIFEQTDANATKEEKEKEKVKVKEAKNSPIEGPISNEDFKKYVKNLKYPEYKHEGGYPSIILRITEVTPEQIGLLPKHTSSLSLPNVKNLTADHIKALPYYPKISRLRLILNGLTSISPDITKELRDNIQTISLASIGNISAETIKNLPRNLYSLNLDNIQTLSTDAINNFPENLSRFSAKNLNHPPIELIQKIQNVSNLTLKNPPLLNALTDGLTYNLSGDITPEVLNSINDNKTRGIRINFDSPPTNAQLKALNNKNIQWIKPLDLSKIEIQNIPNRLKRIRINKKLSIAEIKLLPKSINNIELTKGVINAQFIKNMPKNTKVLYFPEDSISNAVAEELAQKQIQISASKKLPKGFRPKDSNFFYQIIEKG